MKAKKIFLLYIVLLIIGFLSDLIFPNIISNKEQVIFHSSYTIGFTLINLSFPLFIFTLNIFSSELKRKQGECHKAMCRFRFKKMIFGFIMTFILIGMLLSSIQILSKKIYISDTYFQYSSLFFSRELQWSNIENVNGNYVPSNRIGVRGRGSYAWIEFLTTEGETLHFSLRFMMGTNKLEHIIRNRTNQM